jgi:hypothetical protein
MSKFSRAYQYNCYLSSKSTPSIPDSIASMSINGSLPLFKRRLMAATSHDNRAEQWEEPLLDGLVKKWDTYLASTMPPIDLERLQEASWRHLEEEAARSTRAATHRSPRRAAPAPARRRKGKTGGAETARVPKPEGEALLRGNPN